MHLTAWLYEWQNFLFLFLETTLWEKVTILYKKMDKVQSKSLFFIFIPLSAIDILPISSSCTPALYFPNQPLPELHLHSCLLWKSLMAFAVQFLFCLSVWILLACQLPFAFASCLLVTDLVFVQRTGKLPFYLTYSVSASCFWVLTITRFVTAGLLELFH